MSERTKVIGEFIPTSAQDKVHRSAENIGQAAAMLANLSIAGDTRTDRIAIWEAEHQAWQVRQAEAIADAPLGRQLLTDYAAATTQAIYGESVVPAVPNFGE